MQNKARNLLLILCVMLALVAFIFYGYGKTMGAKNRELRAANQSMRTEINRIKPEAAKIQTENDRLKATITEMEQTDEYHYRMAVIKRDEASGLTGKASRDLYGESNVHLGNLISRFPKSHFAILAKKLMEENTRKAEEIQKETNRMTAEQQRAKERQRAEERRRAEARKAAVRKEASKRSKCDLELLSWRLSSGPYGLVTAEGQIKNISNKSLRNVQAVATFYDAQGQFITSGTAIIEYNPILPRQTSPFAAMVSFNPAIEKADIEFKYFGAGTISTYGNKTKRK